MNSSPPDRSLSVFATASAGGKGTQNSGSATATVSVLSGGFGKRPDTSLRASAAGTGGGGGAVLETQAEVQATAGITFDIDDGGLGIATGLTRPVTFSGTISGQQTIDAYNYAYATISITDTLDNTQVFDVSANGPFSVTLNLVPNVPFKVVEAAYAYVDALGAGTTNDLTVTVDPTFVSDDPDYTIYYSPNLITSATTPLPATLPLFASGLCFFGYLTRRRKKGVTQALAA